MCIMECCVCRAQKKHNLVRIEFSDNFARVYYRCSGCRTIRVGLIKRETIETAIEKAACDVGSTIG